MFYISAASTISHQPTFQNAGFSDVIEELRPGSDLIVPNYKEFIDAGLLRRMSKILRMSVTCARECIAQSGIDQPDAIVVGTGLGCLQDTEKFLENFLTIEGLLPPTAFIQSTHNTIAGQISLSLGNHGYNMTHTQNSVSFEHALLDGMLLLSEDDNHVLVGAADEYIKILDEIADNIGLPFMTPLTSGASFFILSKQKNASCFAGIKDVSALSFVTDVGNELDRFVAENEIMPAEIDMILFASPFLTVAAKIFGWLDLHSISESKLVNYSSFSGIYPTNSAFGVHLGTDMMLKNKALKNILVCNCLHKNNLGLTLIQSLEA